MGMIKWLLVGGGVAAVGYLVFSSKQTAERECAGCKRTVTRDYSADNIHWPCPSCAVRAYDQPCRSCAEVAIAQAPMIATKLMEKRAYYRQPGDLSKRQQIDAELVGLPGNIAMLAQRAGLTRPQISLT